MEKAYNIVTKFLKFAIVVVFSILVASCVLQVFTRFVLNSSLSWTEELARYTFIWANMLGAILCTKNKSNATVSVITDNISHENQIVLRKIVNISVSYTHLTLPTTARRCRSRWSPYH